MYQRVELLPSLMMECTYLVLLFRRRFSEIDLKGLPRVPLSSRSRLQRLNLNAWSNSAPSGRCEQLGIAWLCTVVNEGA